jgi:hypothetical protein
MPELLSTRIPGHYWIRVGVSTSRTFERGHSWLYHGMVRRNAWRLGRFSVYLLRMPIRDATADDHTRTG